MIGSPCPGQGALMSDSTAWPGNLPPPTVLSRAAQTGGSSGYLCRGRGLPRGLHLVSGQTDVRAQTELPIAAVTEYRQLSGLKPHSILPQCWRSDVWSRPYRAKAEQALGRLALPVWVGGCILPAKSEIIPASASLITPPSRTLTRTLRPPPSYTGPVTTL